MTEPALRDTFGKFLVNNAKRYKDIVVLDSDLSTSTRTYMFAKKFPDRFFNMGVAEQNMLGTAIGLAISGKIPIVSGFTIFTTGRAWEFIRLACHDNLNLKIIPTHGGFVGEDGSTHHALEDISLMATLPNLNVLIPADNIELIKMMEYAISNNGPFYIRLPRGSFPKIHDDDYNFILGKPDLIKQGSDICILSTGYATTLAADVAKEIEKNFNISLKIINVSTIKPIIEKDLINEVKTLKSLIIIEEHNIYCGLGSIISRIISSNYPLPMKFIGIKNSFGESGKREELLNAYNLTKKYIMKKIKSLLKYI